MNYPALEKEDKVFGYMRIDKTVINNVNKSNILKTIRNQGPVSRAAVARKVELSLPTVMRITDELIAAKLVRETGKGESHGGKPPVMLEFAENAYHIIGVDVGTTNIKAIVMNLAAKIKARVVVPTQINDNADIVIARVISTVRKAISGSGVPESNILGICLGVPGLLDPPKGVVLFSPDFHWENIQLIEPFRKEFAMPIYMVNVTRAMVMGEKWFGLAQKKKNVLCINLGYGIGAAIMINDEIYPGGSDSSGEFGHMVLELEGPKCNCGNYGCLEALASANAICRKAHDLINGGTETTILQHLDNGGQINAKAIYDAAKEGDRLALNLVLESTQYIGVAIANVVNFLDPELIILEGGVAKAGDFLLNLIRGVVEKRQMRYAGRNLRIKTSFLGDDATAIGAGSLILKQLIETGGARVK